MKRIEIQDSVMIDWMHPEIYGTDKPRDVLSIALYHTRASCDIEIEYNSELDGWEIFQRIPIGQFKKGSDGVYAKDEKRKSVGFVPAWDEEYDFSEGYSDN